MAELNRDYALLIGEVRNVTGGTGNPMVGDPANARYDIFARNIQNPGMCLELTGHKINRPLFKGVQVNYAQQGDPVLVIQCPKGLFVIALEQAEFTENCQ